MLRLRTKLCRRASSVLLLISTIQICAVITSARLMNSASVFDRRSDGDPASMARRGAFLDIKTLQRGNVYAVNVHGSSFTLASVDLGQLRIQQQEPATKLTAASLTAALRAAYPGENVGWAWFADTYQEDGWYRLEIRIDEEAPFPDLVKARAAGFVEGNFQAPHMYRYWTNYRSNEYRARGEAPSQDLYDFFDKQYVWMTKRVEAATGWSLAALRGDAPATTATVAAATDRDSMSSNANSTPNPDLDSNGEDDDGGGGDNNDEKGGGFTDSDRRYWTLVGLVAAQFEGLARGFWASVEDAATNMTWHELYTLNSLGDLYDLNVVYPPSAAPAPSAEPPAAPPPPEGAVAGAVSAVRQRHYTPGHGEVGEYGYGELLDCSAIIKIDDEGCGGDGDGSEDDGDDSGDDGDGDDGDGGVGGGITHEDERSVNVQRRARRLAAERVISLEHSRQRRRWWHGSGSAAHSSTCRKGRNFWASHNTWRSYYDMVRTWKVYDLPWASTGPVTISSSPGLLSSKDDWYTTDTFVVMETTNGIYNKALFDLIQPKCVLMWQRVQVANFGARGGSDWVDLFARHNSGTYNNQWMVLDVDRLQEPRVRSDVLWVLEQVPGTTVSQDVTRVLMEQGYWASYNVPYFPEIYNLTGYPQPSIYSTCPRARIFSREQSRLSSLSDVMSLMRLNRYEDDPLSLGLPNNAIAARYDLPAAPDQSGKPRNYTQRAYGAVDAKAVDLESFRHRRTYVINGPTADDQPVFRWSSQPLFDDIRHDGCVDEFNFEWLAYESIVGPPLGPPGAGADVGAGTTDTA